MHLPNAVPLRLATRLIPIEKTTETARHAARSTRIIPNTGAPKDKVIQMLHRFFYYYAPQTLFPL